MAFFVVACVAQRHSHFPAASDIVAPSAEHNRNSEVLYNVMSAQFYARNGNPELALKHFARSARLSDDSEVIGEALLQAIEQADFALGRELADKYLAAGGESPAYRQVLAAAYTVAGEAELAKRQLLFLTEAERDESLFFVKVARLLAAAKPPAEAARLMNALSGQFPDEIQAQSAFAIFALQARAGKVAQLAAENVIRLRPRDHRFHLLRAQALIMQGRVAEDIAAASEYAKTNRKHYLSRVGYVKLLLENDLLSRAQEELLDMLSIWPNNPEIIDKLAAIYFQRRTLADAVSYFSRLLEYQSYQDKSNYYLGRIDALQGHYQDAIERLRKVNYGPYFIGAHSLALETMKKRGNSRLIANYFAAERANRENKRSRAALYLLESQELYTNDKKLESYELLRAAAKAIPEDVDLLYYSGIAAAEIGDKAAAKEAFVMVVEMAPNHFDAHNALGYMYADDNENLLEAKRLVERAYELKGGGAEILDSLGWVEFRLRNFAMAEKFIRLSLEQSRNPVVIGHLVEILLARGNEYQAFAELSRGLEEFPDSGDLQSFCSHFCAAASTASNRSCCPLN